MALATRTEPQFPTRLLWWCGEPSCSDHEEGADRPTCHCLLPDRRDRPAYVSERDQGMILFAVMEPEDAGASRKSTSLELPAAAIFRKTRGF